MNRKKKAIKEKSLIALLARDQLCVAHLFSGLNREQSRERRKHNDLKITAKNNGQSTIDPSASLVKYRLQVYLIGESQYGV